MASDHTIPYARQNSGGPSWADQWDFKNDDETDLGGGHGSRKEGTKLAGYNKRFKAAASTGLDKAKVAATAGANKVKSGTAASIRWIKVQYRKKTQK